MAQERFNIFKRTHKGLSSMVFDAGTKIQQTDFTNAKDAKETISFIGQAVRSFCYHVKNEDTVIYSAVVNFAPFIVTVIEKTSLKDLQLALIIEEKLGEYKKLYNKQDMIVFGADLMAIFFAFTAAVLQHINKEDTVIKELLWSNYNDRELIEMEANITKQLIPDENTWYAKHILKWLNDKEIIVWIAGTMEYGNPGIAESLMQAARTVLPGERWQIISGIFSMQVA